MSKLKAIGIGILSTLIIAFAFLHFYIPGMVEGGMNLVKEHKPYQIRAEAQKLHDELFIVDLHSDSLLWKRNLLIQSDIGHVDIPRLQKGNVALQVFSATTKSPSGQNYEENTGDSDNITLVSVLQMWPIETWGSIYARAVYQLSKLIKFAEDSHGELLIVKSSEDMQRFVASRLKGNKSIAGIYLIEGAHPLEEKLDNLNNLFDQGLRIAGITHFFDNKLAGSLHGISGEGLTAFGKEVIIRANELSLIIDIAHVSPQAVEDILALSTQPVVLSHGGIKGVCDTSRNLSDDLMKKVADKGGIVGIGYWDGAVCDITPKGVVKSIRYAIDLLGVEHVALGSDYDGTTEVLFDTSELAILTQTMLDEGFSKKEIRLVMGENVMYFLLENLPSENDLSS